MDSHENLQRITAILQLNISELSLVIHEHIQFPDSFPYEVLGRHIVALAVDSVRVNERGIAATVSVSIQALLGPRGQAGSAEVREFDATVQVQAIGTQIQDFGDLQFVPPVTLLSWRSSSVERM